MHTENLHRWQHNHAFGQDTQKPGEPRTFLVIAITAAMMVVEIVTGILFGSMALLADGLHMASHTAALGISAFAYVYARRHAHDARYSFGTGKVNSLAGFTGAISLAAFALIMAGESLARLAQPVSIAFDQAIVVAVLGLAINGVSAVILNASGEEHHLHQSSPPPPNTARPVEHHRHADRHHHDHNLRSAYLHVLADALTSLLAIFALLVGKYSGILWMDPFVGLLGALLVARWSLGLLKTTSAVLLDRQGPASMRSAIQNSIETDSTDRISDLHLWSLGSNLYAAVIAVVSHSARSADEIKSRLPKDLGIAHLTVEIHHCEEHGEAAAKPSNAPSPSKTPKRSQLNRIHFA